MRDLEHERKLDRILDDLRSNLTDLAGEPWPDVLEMSMNEAWDQLLKLEAPSE
jgi:hypothetical protein